MCGPDAQEREDRCLPDDELLELTKSVSMFDSIKTDDVMTFLRSTR